MSFCTSDFVRMKMRLVESALSVLRLTMTVSVDTTLLE